MLLFCYLLMVVSPFRVRCVVGESSWREGGGGRLEEEKPTRQQKERERQEIQCWNVGRSVDVGVEVAVGGGEGRLGRVREEGVASNHAIAFSSHSSPPPLHFSLTLLFFSSSLNFKIVHSSSRGAWTAQGVKECWHVSISQSS